MRALILAIALVAAVCLIPFNTALGLSPASVDVQNVLVGGYAKVAFTVSNTEDKVAEFTINVIGPAAAWTSVYPSTSFTMVPKATQKIELIIQPPADAARGTYPASVRVETITAGPNKVSGQALARISSGVEGKINVQVTNQQVLSINVNSIETFSIEEGTTGFLTVEAQNTGNVRATPEVLVKLIDATTNKVLEVRKSAELLPTETRKIEVQLPTEGLRPGNYDLEVSVLLNGREVTSKGLRQKILERGELSTQGQLVSVDAPPWVEAGNFVKVGVLFKNTGSLLSTGEIVGEVLLDGKIIDVLSSKPVKVSPGEQIMLYALYKPQRAGRYTVRASVLFGGKQTDYTEAILNVTSPTAAASTNDSLYYSVALIVVIAGLGYSYRDKLPEVRMKRSE